MVIAGGYDGTNVQGDVVSYDPTTDKWTLWSSVGPIASRYSHAAVWTGSQMILWGGIDDSNSPTNTGTIYNPAQRSVVKNMNTAGAPTARYYCEGVWSGTDVIVWGGVAGTAFNDGARYNPTTDKWASMAATSLAGRERFSLTWTGKEMIIWGGDPYGPSGYNDGAVYSAAGNSWSALPTLDAPPARYGHTAVWTGHTMIVWGGNPGRGGQFDTGGRYVP
jgi:N-acetylneuraminic acid mutarotase